MLRNTLKCQNVPKHFFEIIWMFQNNFEMFPKQIWNILEQTDISEQM